MMLTHLIPKTDYYVHLPEIWCECMPYSTWDEPSLIIHERYEVLHFEEPFQFPDED